MSRKKMKGNRFNHRLAADKLGSKRKRSTFNLKIQENAPGTSRVVERSKCSDCGASIIYPYMGSDNVIRCARCAVKHISASRSE